MSSIVLLTHLTKVYATDEIIMENLIENIGEETYSAPDLDIIEYYRENPINLLDTEADILATLPGISLITAQTIINLVANNPNIKNYAIADICGLSPEAEILLDVCTIISKSNKNDIKQGLITRTRYRHKFEDVKGISSGNYLGGKEDLYNRIIAYYSDYEVGVVANKHSGEVNYDEFLSGYARFDNSNSKIIAGDFYADYGMGTLLWRTFAAQKGSEVISPVLSLGSGIAPYRSTLDFAHFRGIAAQSNVALGDSANLRISGFYSNNLKSATIDTANSIASSVYLASYYRTQNDISKKNALNEEAVSFNLELSTSGGLIAGLTSLTLDYNYKIVSRSSVMFNGKSGNLFSGYAMYKLPNNLIGFETAIDANSNKLIRAGYIYSSKELEFALSGRYIDMNFRSPYGYSFGEFSYPANEQGIYASVVLKLSNNLSIALFNDIFSSVGRTFTIPAKVHGMDFFTEIKYKLQAKSNFILRLRRDSKSTLLINNDDERTVGEGIKYSARVEYSNELDKKIMLRLRGEISNYSDELDNDNGSGAMSFIDLRWKAIDNLRVGMRYTLFSTDNFNSAIYQYEYTMPGTMRTTALFDSGSRVIFTADYSPSKFIKIYANYIAYSKNNVDYIGIGNEQLPANYDNRAILQVEFHIK